MAGCLSDRPTELRSPGAAAELHVSARLAATTIATIVVRVSAEDIDPPLAFNLTLENGVAVGVLRIPAGSARTISVVAFDENGVETHRGERTLDVQPGNDNPPVSITLLPAAGSQPVDAWLGALAVTISEVPTGLRVGESATLTASVVMATPDGPIPVQSASVQWATATPGIVAIDAATGLVTAVGPGRATVAATYGGAGALAELTVDPRLGYYASPTGTPSGAGTWQEPWDLRTALSGAAGVVRPGDVIWLRGGDYIGTFPDFRSTLAGTPDQPIILRRYPGERATIVGRLQTFGEHTIYWGFEIRQDNPLDPGGPPALNAHAPGAKYVNLVIHDAGENGVSFRTETGVSELYGSIIFNNGNTEGFDHGVYASSEATVVEKRIVDNVVFNNAGSGIQVFGDESHSAIKNVRVTGNISFNNSSIAGWINPARRGNEENINFGGDKTPVENIVVEDNLLYFSPGVSTGFNLRAGNEIKDAGDRNVSATIRDNYIVGGKTLVRLDDWEQATVEGNTLVAPGGERVVHVQDLVSGLGGVVWNGNTYHRDPAATAWRYNATVHEWAEFRTATGLGATDAVSPGLPTAPTVVVRPNAYERGRANIAVYNPAGTATVSVDVSAILRAGDRYEVRNVQDLFGTPLLAGVYAGELLALPMAGVAPPPAVGRGTAPITGPYFNAFVLTLRER